MFCKVTLVLMHGHDAWDIVAVECHADAIVSMLNSNVFTLPLGSVSVGKSLPSHNQLAVLSVKLL